MTIESNLTWDHLNALRCDVSDHAAAGLGAQGTDSLKLNSPTAATDTL